MSGLAAKTTATHTKWLINSTFLAKIIGRCDREAADTHGGIAHDMGWGGGSYRGRNQLWMTGRTRTQGFIHWQHRAWERSPNPPSRPSKQCCWAPHNDGAPFPRGCAHTHTHTQSVSLSCCPTPVLQAVCVSVCVRFVISLSVWDNSTDSIFPHCDSRAPPWEEREYSSTESETPQTHNEKWIFSSTCRRTKAS